MPGASWGTSSFVIVSALTLFPPVSIAARLPQPPADTAPETAQAVIWRTADWNPALAWRSDEARSAVALRMPTQGRSREVGSPLATHPEHPRHFLGLVLKFRLFKA